MTVVVLHPNPVPDRAIGMKGSQGMTRFQPLSLSASATLMLQMVAALIIAFSGTVSSSFLSRSAATL